MGWINSLAHTIIKNNYMGTRNLTSVIYNKKTKVAQYGQWDGYPDGVGLGILNFLRKVDLNKFKKELKKVKFISETKIREKIKEVIGEDKDWIDMEESNKIKEKYPELHRDTGCNILELIYEGKVTELKDESEFAKDELFCEYHWVIDLDNNTFNCGDVSFDLDNLPTDKEFLKEFK